MDVLPLKESMSSHDWTSLVAEVQSAVAKTDASISALLKAAAAEGTTAPLSEQFVAGWKRLVTEWNYWVEDNSGFFSTLSAKYNPGDDSLNELWDMYFRVRDHQIAYLDLLNAAGMTPPKGDSSTVIGLVAVGAVAFAFFYWYKTTRSI